MNDRSFEDIPVECMGNPFIAPWEMKRSFRVEYMNELILLLLAVVGVISLAGSYVLITLGRMIDEFPDNNDKPPARTNTSPGKSTKIAVVLFWVIFLPGSWAVLQEGIVAIITGITLLFAICLFMLTAIIFSFQVLAAMSRKKHENAVAVTGKNTSHLAVNGSSSPAPAEAGANTVRERNSRSKSLIGSLLKK
jgi:hypothetical protein